MKIHPWAEDSKDSTDYILLDRWERRLLAMNPRTPAELRSSIKKLPEFVSWQKAWDKYCNGSRKKSWKGIVESAEEMHYFAGIDDRGWGLGNEVKIQTAANLIIAVVPILIREKRREYNKNAWSKLRYCKLCWRLAPAGNSSILRPPFCEKHKPLIIAPNPKKEGTTVDKKNPEYRRNNRLLKYFNGPDGHLEKTKKKIGSIKRWDLSVSPENFPYLHQYLKSIDPNINNTDLNSILFILLTDVSDHENKIHNTISEWLKSDKNAFFPNHIFVFRTFVLAEAWLSLFALKKTGGDMKSKNSGYVYSASFKQKAVKRALTSNKPVAQTAKNLGIPENTLYSWVKKERQNKK